MALCFCSLELSLQMGKINAFVILDRMHPNLMDETPPTSSELLSPRKKSGACNTHHNSVIHASGGSHNRTSFHPPISLQAILIQPEN
jgi:hypothetical protein